MNKIDKIDLKKLEEQINAKVQSNFSYRTLIASHPESWLLKDFDITVPKDKKVVIIARDEEVNTAEQDTIFLVIPIPKASSASEISDHQLDMVAGGVGNFYFYGRMHHS